MRQAQRRLVDRPAGLREEVDGEQRSGRRRGMRRATAPSAVRPRFVQAAPPAAARFMPQPRRCRRARYARRDDQQIGAIRDRPRSQRQHAEEDASRRDGAGQAVPGRRREGGERDDEQEAAPGAEQRGGDQRGRERHEEATRRVEAAPGCGPTGPAAKGEGRHEPESRIGDGPGQCGGQASRGAASRTSARKRSDRSVYGILLRCRFARRHRSARCAEMPRRTATGSSPPHAPLSPRRGIEVPSRRSHAAPAWGWARSTGIPDQGRSRRRRPRGGVRGVRPRGRAGARRGGRMGRLLAASSSVFVAARPEPRAQGHDRDSGARQDAGRSDAYAHAAAAAPAHRAGAGAGLAARGLRTRGHAGRVLVRRPGDRGDGGRGARVLAPLPRDLLDGLRAERRRRSASAAHAGAAEPRDRKAAA